MRYRTIGIFVVFGLLVAVVFAQAPSQMPKPGPEQKKLAYYAGTWKSEGEMKASPFGPAGKATTTDHCEWFMGGFHLVCHSTGRGPIGAMKGLGIIGYNAGEKLYTYYGIDNMGMGSLSKGIVEGNTWTWNGEDKMGGKMIKSRYTIVETSPTAYNFKWETSEDGSTWSAIMEGKTAKTAAEAEKAKETGQK